LAANQRCAEGSCRRQGRVSDGDQYSKTATVSITVSPVNDQPVATPANVSSVEDTPKNITLEGSDPEDDPLTFAIVAQPQYGTMGSISVTGTTTATVAYTSAANYSGPDGFTFRVNDGLEDSVPATVSISVQSANDAPVADPQSVSTAEETALTITLSPAGTTTGTPSLLTSQPTRHTGP
jgi:VCBS repeat-containing protein